MATFGRVLMGAGAVWILASLPLACAAGLPPELLGDVAITTWPGSLGDVVRAAIYAAYAAPGIAAIAWGSSILRRERWR